MNESVKILIVDDEADYLETHRMLLENKGYIINSASNVMEALAILSVEYYPIVITDVIMPDKDGFYLLQEIKKNFNERIQVIVVTGHGSITAAVKAMKEGALGYFIKSHNPEELFIEIEKARRVVKFETIQSISNRDYTSKFFLQESKNQKIKSMLLDIETLSDSDCNILITGESGVGKEIFAKYIHEKSRRAREIFLPTNCQSLSPPLLEAELFGHEKGAFTGATIQRIGRFEEASGGTMFLDEIGELSENIQVKLLRVLDTRFIERIGSNKQIPVKFRLISATSRNLDNEIKLNNFREDLFYRINTIHFVIPPLRERREDLEAMIQIFIQQYANEIKKTVLGIEPETHKHLLQYDYPGNVRELKNMIERMIVLSRDGVLRMDLQNNTNYKEYPQPKVLLDYVNAKKQFESQYFRAALLANDFNIAKTADIIKISRRQLFNKIIEYNLKSEF
ncbi:MAG: sigma-54-dependent Fis family transcriptional regulator [Clostridia bacterium]|nr:sigma-54-dependent Fis family transcriptional regulator [Clostridia bacterium]